MRYKVSEGPVVRAQRVLLYGPEGIGKSTMAGQMPDPLFIDVEDGTTQLYVRRLPVPVDWAMLLSEVRDVREDREGTATIVIDTLDAAERLCQAEVCRVAKKKSIEDWGYGKGYKIAAERFQELLDELDRCANVGINVVAVAHSQLRKVERPDESGAYDRFEVKLHKLLASAVKEWADAVLFLDYETFVSVDESGKGHAEGGKRVIRCSHSVAWDAKNRWGLPDRLMLDEGGTLKVRENLPVFDAAAKPTAAQATHPNPGLVADMAKVEARRREAKGPKETATEGKRPSAPKRLRPLFELCQERGVHPWEVKAVMVERGKRDESQSVADWEAPFVQWVCRNADRVVELVEAWRRANPGKAQGDTDVYDDDIPF